MYSYTTKSKVENYLAITIDTSLDAQVTEWIKAVSTFIERYTKRFFNPADTTTTRFYDGNGKKRLCVDDFTEVSGIVIAGFNIVPAAIDSTGYVLYPANRPVRNEIELRDYFYPNSRVGNSGYTFYAGQQNIEVTAKFGWDETPSDIALVATKLVGGIIKEAVGDKDVHELMRENLGDYEAINVPIKDIAHALKVSEVLDQYLVRPKGSVVTGIREI